MKPYTNLGHGGVVLVAKVRFGVSGNVAGNILAQDEICMDQLRSKV
jgi:hypothetical protein